MNLLKLRAIVAAVAVLSLALATRGQQRAPRIGYVVPAGGKQGATFQVAIGGRYLDGASKVIVSGDGVEAMVIEHNKPLRGAEFQLLRDKLKELTARKLAATRAAMPARPGSKFGNGRPARPAPPTKAPATPKAAPPAKARAKGKPVKAPISPTAPTGRRPAKTKPPAKPTWSDADERMLAEVRHKLRNAPNRKIAPSIFETVFVEVKVAPDAPPGKRELRMATKLGVTNPMVFYVGQLPEFNEATPVSTAQITSYRAARAPADTDTEVTSPAVLNGQIMPGDVDRFKFKARKGQRLVILAAARELMPYLADAVPGWFEATLALYDSKGGELAYVDRYRFHQDPVLYHEIETDDEYVVEIRDSIYRGRQDFVYRISVGQLPFITSIFPLGGKAGGRTAVELAGWNLPAAGIVSDDRDRAPGIYPISVGTRPRVSNSVPFAVDDLPECLDRSGNDKPQTAQKVKLPIIVNGRIDKPGDRDVFSFEGAAGGEVVAAVVARRLGSPLDLVLKLTDSAGKQLAYNDDKDDKENKGAGLETHHADSYIRARLPAGGTYYVHLVDIQEKGGREYAYRLRISQPRPDFELRVVPSSINMRAGASVPITVWAIRKDGFDGEIKLAMKPARSIFKLSGAWIPAGQDQVRLTLTAPRAAMKQPVNLALEGKAAIAGRTLVHQAVPAEDMMQAFIYRHLVASRDLKVDVIGGYAARAPVTLASETPVKIPVGGTAQVRFKRPGRGRPAAAQIQLELNDPPEGITIQKASLAGSTPTIVLKSDSDRVKPGQRGNLIVNAYVVRSVPASKGSTKMVKRRFLVGALPAMPFEVVAGNR